MKGSIVVAKNRTFTGGRKSVGTPTLNKESYFQLIRMIRNSKNSKNSKNEGEDIERTSGKSKGKH